MDRRGKWRILHGKVTLFIGKSFLGIFVQRSEKPDPWRTFSAFHRKPKKKKERKKIKTIFPHNHGKVGSFFRYLDHSGFHHSMEKDFPISTLFPQKSVYTNMSLHVCAATFPWKRCKKWKCFCAVKKFHVWWKNELNFPWLQGRSFPLVNAEKVIHGTDFSQRYSNMPIVFIFALSKKDYLAVVVPYMPYATFSFL